MQPGPGQGALHCCALPQGKNGTSTSPGPPRPPNNIWRQMLTIFFLTKFNLTLPLIRRPSALFPTQVRGYSGSTCSFSLCPGGGRGGRDGRRCVAMGSCYSRPGGVRQEEHQGKTFFLTTPPVSWLFHATSAPPQSHQPQAKRPSTSLPLGLPPTPQSWSLSG